MPRPMAGGRRIGMDTLHALLAKDIVIDSPLAADVSAAEAEIRLSEQQFALLDMLAAQRRALILALLARARRSSPRRRGA